MVEPRSASDEDDDSEEEVEKQMTQPERDALLMKGVKDNDFEQVVEAIKLGAYPTCEEGGWNPLLWAACNGNEGIVRHLIKNQAHLKYKEHDEENNAAEDEEEEKDNFKPVPDPAKVGRHTPMHWASYHGHLKVIWQLMKENMNPLLQDIHGNNCIHQAAANSQIYVLKCFMQFGVDLQLKNARVHTPLDLATDPETRKLIQRGIKTVHCVGNNCGNSKFDFRNIQFYCSDCGEFYCKLCSTKAWVFEHKDSEVPERPVCRCDKDRETIINAEQTLRNAMASHDFHVLDKAYNSIKEIDIDVKLRHEAEVLHLKLEKELDIRNFIQSVAHVDNYKTIRKSVTVLNKKFEDAEKLGVEVDPNLIKQINECSNRLISERNLRFDMENMDVSRADKDTVDHLQKLIDLAQEYNVDQKYMKHATGLGGKMNDSIEARETLQLLLDYPIREYPEPEPLDAKGKPIKQKDDKKKAKKRKKKEPPFPMPEWAANIDDLIKTIKKIQELAARAEELNLDAEFLGQHAEQMKRFKQEISYRKMRDEEDRLENEAKLLAKKKKKK